MDVRVRTSAEDLKQYDYSMRVDCHAYGTVNAKSKADAKERINEGQWDDIDIDVEDIVTINEISLSKNQPGATTVTEIVSGSKTIKDKATDEVREHLIQLEIMATNMIGALQESDGSEEELVYKQYKALDYAIKVVTSQLNKQAAQVKI